MLRRNVGGIDRVLRVVFGTFIFIGGLLLLSGKPSIGVTIAVVGLLALLTGVIRFCALYIPFGISTARPQQSQMKRCCECAPSIQELPGKNGGASTARPRDAVTPAATTTHHHP